MTHSQKWLFLWCSHQYPNPKACSNKSHKQILKTKSPKMKILRSIMFRLFSVFFRLNFRILNPQTPTFWICDCDDHAGILTTNKFRQNVPPPDSPKTLPSAGIAATNRQRRSPHARDTILSTMVRLGGWALGAPLIWHTCLLIILYLLIVARGCRAAMIDACDLRIRYVLVYNKAISMCGLHLIIFWFSTGDLLGTGDFWFWYVWSLFRFN